MVFLQNRLLQFEDELHHSPLLYVCKSLNLAEQMRRGFSEAYPDYDTDFVQFKSYQTLLMEIGLDNLVGRSDFDEWFSRYLSRTKKQQRKQERVKDAECVYQEFRIISGLPEINDYLDLGQRQSGLPENQRRFILNAYEAYQKKLTVAGQIHPDFYALEPLNRYGLIVADEAQDLSRRQLDNLIEMAKNKSIVFCRKIIRRFKIFASPIKI